MSDLFPMVEVKNLEKKYLDYTALNKITLHFYQKQFVALAGRNGSGKSTLMRMLSQRETYDSGSIYFQNQSFFSPRVQFLSDVVFITEDQNLPIAKNLEWWRDQYKSLSPEYNLSVFDRLVHDFKLDPSKYFMQMSRGQKMKALFALLAPRGPKVYLLDEITSVLDSGSRWALMNFLKKEAENGSLVIMSTNIAGEMQGFANHVCVLEQGSLQLSAAASELGKYFEKFRMSPSQESEIQNLERNGARRIMRNSDGSWSLLMKKADQINPGSLDSIASPPLEIQLASSYVDRREVSIDDVAAYYTTSELLK